MRLSWETKRALREYNPRIAIFVDDIGITASGITRERMLEHSQALENMLVNFDPHQKLPINPKKKKVLSHADGIEHLGLRLGRKKVSMGSKTSSKRDRIRNKLKNPLSKDERADLLKKNRAYHIYQQQIAKTKKAA